MPCTCTFMSFAKTGAPLENSKKTHLVTWMHINTKTT